MRDCIVMERIWQDDYYFQIKIDCISEFVSATTKVYTSNQCIDELSQSIKNFLSGKANECFWLNGEKGDETTACVSMKISHKDKLGHIQIEVYMEINDGGRLSEHNCCFYVNTELGLLTEFQKDLYKIKNQQLGAKVILNHIEF